MLISESISWNYFPWVQDALLASHTLAWLRFSCLPTTSYSIPTFLWYVFHYTADNFPTFQFTFSVAINCWSYSCCDCLLLLRRLFSPLSLLHSHAEVPQSERERHTYVLLYKPIARFAASNCDCDKRPCACQSISARNLSNAKGWPCGICNAGALALLLGLLLVCVELVGTAWTAWLVGGCGNCKAEHTTNQNRTNRPRKDRNRLTNRLQTVIQTVRRYHRKDTNRIIYCWRCWKFETLLNVKYYGLYLLDGICAWFVWRFVHSL